VYSNSPLDRIHLHQSEAAVFAENSHHAADNVLILANVRSRQTLKSLTFARHEIRIYQYVNSGGLEEVRVCIKTMATSHFKISSPPFSVRPVRSCLRPRFSSVLVYTAFVYSTLFYVHRFLSTPSTGLSSSNSLPSSLLRPPISLCHCYPSTPYPSTPCPPQLRVVL